MSNAPYDVDARGHQRPLHVQDRVGDCDRVVVTRPAPGWVWLISVVTVSLGLWAGLIWAAARVLDWLS